MDIQAIGKICWRGGSCSCCSVFVLSLFFCIIWGLYHKASPVLAASSWEAILFSSDWHPTQGRFGMAGFIAGTLWVTDWRLSWPCL